MAIIIKEIHVKTTVEKRAETVTLSRETMEVLKRSILKELEERKLSGRSQTLKDR